MEKVANRARAGTDPPRPKAGFFAFFPTDASWCSPDSKQLVYSFPVRDALELFIISLDGASQRQFTTFSGTSLCMPSAWSLDGNGISFRGTDARYCFARSGLPGRVVWRPVRTVLRPGGNQRPQHKRLACVDEGWLFL